VTVPAVANWRKRFDDFPPEVDKQGRTPLFNKDAVVEWLTANNKLGAPNDQLQAVMWALADMMRNTSSSSAEFLSLIVEPDAPHENIPSDTREEFTRSYNSLVEQHGERPVFDTFLPIVSRAAGRKFAEHDTHPELLRLLTALSDTPEHATIYDPCVGMGSALEAIATPTSTLYGQDINQNAAKVAAKRFTLHGYNNTVTAGDSIATDNFPDVVADRVFTAPPLGLQLHERHIDRHDPRWTVEIPNARQSDSAFIQIVLAHMNEHGKAIVHLSNSTLFTRNEIREYLVRNNLLDAVISLPSGAIANTNITSCLLILDRTRPLSTPTRQTPTLFVDLLDNQPKGLATSYVDELIDIWNNWDHRDHQHPNTVAATLSQIAENEFDLTPTRYVAAATYDWPRGLPWSNDEPDDTAEHDLNRIADDFRRISETINTPVFEQFPQSPDTTTLQLRDLPLTVIRGTAPPKQQTGNVITPILIADAQPVWERIEPPHSSDVEKQTAIRSDIVVALSAADNANRVAIVTDEWQGYDLSRDVIILRAPNNEVPVIIASYLYFWLMTPAWQHHLELHTRGFMNNLSRKDLMHFDIPITDVGTQVAVSRALEQAMQHNVQLNSTLNALQQLTHTHRELVMEHAAANIMRGIQ